MTDMHSINPATGEVIWQGSAATLPDIQRTVEDADQAFAQWRQKSISARSVCIERFRDVLKRRKEHLAETIAKETGKTLWDARSEVDAMIGKVAISIKAYEERTGKIENEGGDIRNVVRHRPHGPVAVLGPYNFPGHLPNGHIIPALLAGNTVVFKPSELTPLVAEETLRCWREAKLPDGVLGIVQGNQDIGAAVVSHPLIRGLFFTGSSTTGRKLHKQFGGYPEKLLALEMGGNNPLVVWHIKDIYAAAYYTIQSAFITTGQRCTCARRLILSQNNKADRFLHLLLAMAGQMKIGIYTEQPEPFMGPVISMIQAHHLLNAQQKLIQAGGRLLLEMKNIRPGLPFLSPGFIDVTHVQQLPDEEYFGPLLQIIRVPNFDRAIDQANNTAYGLTAAIFTDEEKLYDRFRQQVRSGLVNWNRQTTGASSAAPFGGIGISGNHHPSAYYAADYCAYPVASLEANKLTMPRVISPGLKISEPSYRTKVKWMNS